MYHQVTLKHLKSQTSNRNGVDMRGEMMNNQKYEFGLEQWALNDLMQASNFTVDGSGRSVFFRSAEESYHVIDSRRFLAQSESKLPQLGTAQFEDVDFRHVFVPEVVLDWQRKDKSVECMTIIFRMQGNYVISADQPLPQRAPGITIVPPGKVPLKLETDKPFNELIKVSLGRRIYRDILFVDDIPKIDATALDISPLQPLFAFIISICESKKAPKAVAQNLEAAAQMVARSLLLSAIGSQEHREKRSTYSLVKEFVMRYYENPSIGVKDAARFAGVSVRTLQTALREEDTEFTSMLRLTRVFAVKSLQSQHPHLTDERIMQACGFGSPSSYYRAMREYAGKVPDLTE